MRGSSVVLAALALWAWAANAGAGESACPADYFGGSSPEIANAALRNQLRELCFEEFSVVHSGVTATPLWSAQRLTRGEVRAAKGVERDNVFHAEEALPKAERAELSHYRRSGFDRGHLAPAADMASVKAQDESFSLANMVPQEPGLNRGPWADIEDTTRRLAAKHGEVYVVTGALFGGEELKRIGGRVFVPSEVYKAVYLPATGQAGVWTGDNATGSVALESVADFEARSGVTVFPALPGSVKATAMALPVPATGKHGAENRDGWSVETQSALEEMLAKAAPMWKEWSLVLAVFAVALSLRHIGRRK